MKKELGILGSTAPLLASLGLTGLAIGGAAFLGYIIIKTLNKKGMALSDEDKKFIVNEIKKAVNPIYERLGNVENDVIRLHTRLKGFREFWVADTVEDFIKNYPYCNGKTTSIINIDNPQGININVGGAVLPSLEVDRIFYVKCKGRSKNKIIILEITETLTADMLNPKWITIPEEKLYEKEMELFQKKFGKKDEDFTERDFKNYLKINNKLLYKYGRYVDGVPIKDFYKKLAKEELSKLNINPKNVEYLYYYAAMYIPNKEAVIRLAEKLGIGILKVSASLGNCSELVKPRVF